MFRKEEFKKRGEKDTIKYMEEKKKRKKYTKREKRKMNNYQNSML